MEWLRMVFPIATAGFVLLFFSEYFPTLRAAAPLPPVSPAEQRLSGKDRLLMLLITAVYALVAFTGLGVNRAPQSFCYFQEKGQQAVLELKEETHLSAVMYYGGLKTGSYRLQFSADGESWRDQDALEQSYSDLYKWKQVEGKETAEKTKYIRIVADGELYLGEIALYDESGARMAAADIRCSDGAERLLDEQDTVPDIPSYLNSSYFDEIYHPRTALEHILGMTPYEITHPPLGKILLGLGIRLFGMTPFGWRFMGTLLGVLMLPLLYLFVKKLFGGTVVPGCCSMIFAADFMHFTQTRIATIDTYGVFFTLLMYLFFYAYLTAERGVNAPRRGWLLPLALSGICFGLGAASKWTCLYAGAGLGFLWLMDRLARGRKLCRSGKGESYRRETVENILWCLLFFVAVPALIYYLSYYPYGRAAGMDGLGMVFRRDYLDLVLRNQKYMLSYHAGVTATHPYSSRWYQWILDIRPILYYLEYMGENKSAFGAFVNPVLCWGGLLAMLLMGWWGLFKKDNKALFIFVGYLAQLLPWCFVQRVVFFYHYFPCTLFLLLALGHVFHRLRSCSPAYVRLLASFTGLAVGLFAAFYPVLSGLTVPRWYTTNFLRWLPEFWPF